jgi:hypothetical protein
VLLAALLWMRAGRRLLFPIAAIVTLAFALPFASENTLNGSQSCLYFVLFGLVVPLALMPDARPASPPWWLALAVLALGVVAFAGGSLNVVCLAVGLVLARAARRSWRPLAMDLAACALVAAVAIALRAPSPPEHAAYVASDVQHFSLLAFGALAFPFVREPTMAAVVWIPSMLLVGSLLRERRMPDPLEGTLLALAAWVFVQAAAIGYSRGSLSSVPPSRYLDVFSFVFVINMVAAVWLARGRAPDATTFPRVVIAAWGGVLLLGLAQQAHVDVVDFAAVRGTDATAHRENIRRYLGTGDREWFAGLTFPHEVPVHVPALLSEVLLADPFLRARLPPALGEPLALRASRGGPGPFRREGVRPPATADALADAWGSYDGHDGAGVGVFKSRSIACSWGALVRVDVTGELNEGNMELRMVTDAGRVGSLASTFLPSGRWQPIWARCPPGPFRIVARDWDSAHWFAVGSPIEYGWLSFLAEAALARVWLPLAVGALLAAWAASRHRDPHRRRCDLTPSDAGL